MMRARRGQEDFCTTSYDTSRWSRPEQYFHLMEKQKFAISKQEDIIQVHTWMVSFRYVTRWRYHRVNYAKVFLPPGRYLQTEQLHLPPASADSSWACGRGWKQPLEMLKLQESLGHGLGTQSSPGVKPGFLATSPTRSHSLPVDQVAHCTEMVRSPLVEHHSKCHSLTHLMHIFHMQPVEYLLATHTHTHYIQLQVN